MALLQISEPGQTPDPHQRRIAVGIDLGTTHSLVAAVRHGTAECLPDEQGRVFVTILSPTEASSDTLQVTAAPRVASLADRFELAGRAFCADADANNVTIGGMPALVLASSPMSLVVLPPGNLPAVDGCA